MVRRHVSRCGQTRGKVPAGAAPGSLLRNRRATKQRWRTAYLVLDVAEAALGLLQGRPNTLRALEIYTRLGDLSGQATAANNLGVGAYFEGRWNEAIDFYAQARRREEDRRPGQRRVEQCEHRGNPHGSGTSRRV